MAQPVPPRTEDDEHLPALFAGILFVLLLSIAGLYWLGAHFS